MLLIRLTALDFRGPSESHVWDRCYLFWLLKCTSRAHAPRSRHALTSDTVFWAPTLVTPHMAAPPPPPPPTPTPPPPPPQHQLRWRRPARQHGRQPPQQETAHTPCGPRASADGWCRTDRLNGDAGGGRGCWGSAAASCCKSRGCCGCGMLVASASSIERFLDFLFGLSTGTSHRNLPSSSWPRVGQ